MDELEELRKFVAWIQANIWKYPIFQKEIDDHIFHVMDRWEIDPLEE